MTVATALLVGLAGVVIAGAALLSSRVPVAPGVPTWVTGRVMPAPSACNDPSPVVDGDVIRTRGGECNPQTWTTSDPRLTGKVSWRWSEDTYTTDEGIFSVSTGAAYMRNEVGGWACTSIELWVGEAESAVTEGSADTTFTCVGDGGYTGLSAILVLGAAPGGGTGIMGLVVAGDFPPLPEPPAAE